MMERVRSMAMEKLLPEQLMSKRGLPRSRYLGPRS